MSPGNKRKITLKTVSFRSSIEIGKFQHAHIEASAEVPVGTDPQQVLDSLKTWVAKELVRAKNGETPKPAARAGRFRDILEVSTGR